MHLPVVRGYALSAEPACLDTCCWDVRDRFMADPQLESVPVLAEDGGITAMLYRHAYIDLMSSQFGHALFRRRPVSRLQNQPVFTTDFLTCQADDTVPAVAGSMQQHAGDRGTTAVVVLDGSNYQGILTHGGVLRAMLDLARSQQESVQLLMDHLPLGVLSVDAALVVDPVYSATTSRMLGTDRIPGQELDALLQLDERRQGQLRDFLDMLRTGMLDPVDLEPLNPLLGFDFQRTVEQRYLRMQFFQMAGSEQAGERVLGVLEDITVQHATELELARKQEENAQLRAIAEDPDLFRDFISETRAILTRVGPLIAELADCDQGERREQLIHAIFRGVHTIKGGSSSLKLGEVTQIAGGMEDALSPLREHPEDAEFDELLPMLQDGLQRLAQALDRVCAISRKLLGDEVEDPDDPLLHIHLLEIHKLMAEAQRLSQQLNDERCCHFVGRLAELRHIPARKAFARAIKLVPGVAERLGKEVDFRMLGSDEGVDCRYARELTAALVHLLRNAIDHGLEDADLRLQRGKSATGSLTLSVSQIEDKLLVQVRDDGAGLDLDQIRARGIELGLLDTERELNQDQAMELLFAPGFTTAGQISDISGRGVGLDAVKDAVVDGLGGKIEIDSQPGKGCCFRLIVPQQQFTVTVV